MCTAIGYASGGEWLTGLLVGLISYLVFIILFIAVIIWAATRR